MASGDKKVNITAKRILGWQHFKDNLLDYLIGRDEDLVQKVYKTSGVFKALGLAADGNDEFKITGFTGEAVVAIDGLGNFLDLDSRSEDVEDVQFENTVATDYYVGIRKASVPDGLTISQLDGQPNFDTYEEIVGWEGTPDSVTDNFDGTLTFVVDAVTEASRSNAGRKVSVWKIVPGLEATTESVAWEEKLTVAWAAGNNKITTVANFGQGATPSTVAAHYTVVLHGPRVSRDTDLRTETEYCFIGIITGAGAGNPPAVFDVTDQELMDIPLSDLAHIVRYENVPPNRLKIDVKALAAEEGSNISQIQVSGWDGVGGPKTVFIVDELGNVTIEGDLTVEGTTTQEDVVQVNSSETITQNLTAGDANTDTHVIKGEWTHNVVAVGDRFTIDGDTGRVGIGGAYDGANALKVTGTCLVTSNLETTGTLDVTNAATFKTSVNIEAAAPLFRLKETGATANEGVWRFLADGDTFEMRCYNDLENAFEAFLTVERSAHNPDVINIRGVGTNAEINLDADRVGLGGDHSGGADSIECFFDFLPNGAGGGTRNFGSATARFDTAFLEVGLDIEQAAPFIRIKETGATANEGVWKFKADGDILVFQCDNDAENDLNTFFKVTRTANDSTTLTLTTTVATGGKISLDTDRIGLGGLNSNVDVVESYLSIIPDTTNTLSIGQVTPAVKIWGNIFGHVVHAYGATPGYEWYDSGDGVGEKRWRMEVDANSDLQLVTQTDGGGAGSMVLRVDRVGDSTDLVKLIFGTHLTPAADNALDLGLGGGNAWRAARFTSLVYAQSFQATGDPAGGDGSTTTFTNGTAAAAAGDSQVYAGGNTNAGFLKVWVGITPGYVPYWTAIT